MNEEFKAFGCKTWAVTDECFVFGGTKIAYEDISSIAVVSIPSSPLTNGVAQLGRNGKILTLGFKHADKKRAQDCIEFVKERIDAIHGKEANYKYKLVAHTGTKLEVYDDYLIIYHLQTGAFFANVMNGGALGGKKIEFSDLTSIQFREPAGATVGFIQFAYPGSAESKGGLLAAINDENSIPFQPCDLPLAQEIVNFIENRRKEIKSKASMPIQQQSTADEIAKFKQLCDSGIITQEEFDAKKKQLLGL